MRRYLLVTAAMLVVSPAMGAGWYNMPTSLPQCLGIGFGPGYHAPMLLGPAYKAPEATQTVRRLPAALRPYSASPYGYEPTCLGAAPINSHPVGMAEFMQSPQQTTTYRENNTYRQSSAPAPTVARSQASSEPYVVIESQASPTRTFFAAPGF
jgi:hypothetical protein